MSIEDYYCFIVIRLWLDVQVWASQRILSV